MTGSTHPSINFGRALASLFRRNDLGRRATGLRILVPLPDRDFDLTQVAVSWKLLTEAGYRVVFATENGATPACGPSLITDVALGALGATPEAIAFYREMQQDPAFHRPIRWDDADVWTFDGLLLPGGRAPGISQCLESWTLRAQIAELVSFGRPFAAIGLGVLVAARSVDERTRRSILHGRRKTCVLEDMERRACLPTARKLGSDHRTYPEHVEDEVRAALAKPSHLVRGPHTLVSHGSTDGDASAFVLEDGAYLSARGAGDVYLLVRRFMARLQATESVRAGRAPAHPRAHARLRLVEPRRPSPA
jgi:putative intracellular protease/amidase